MIEINDKMLDKNNVHLLRSYEDFLKWHKAKYDFSMFGEQEIKEALKEDSPKCYPCIPLLLDTNQEITYIGFNIIECLFHQICSLK